MFRTLRPILLASLLLTARAVPAQEAPGIYADFATSRGDFTARLDYERAPKAVAAFVGLATGEKNWLDAFGNVHSATPFYDGTLFHRVLPGLAIQGGAAPVPAAAWAETNNGPAVLLGLNASFTIEIPPGGATNTIDEMAFVFTNAPSVPTNASFGGIASDILQTNRTLQQVWMVSRSSCALGTIVQTNVYRNERVANPTLSPSVTECTVPLAFHLPNPTNVPLVYTNAISLRWLSTNSIALLAAPVATNFSNAGFVYPDAFSNGLSHTAGTLSMANSGPNHDGSQFFVCAADYTNWDGHYTAFGHVVSSMDVVSSIASVEVATNNANRPLEDIFLRGVSIRRVGTAAEGFDIHAQGLPRVDNLPVGLSFGPTQAVASIDLPAQTEVAFRRTDDLRAPVWTAWQTTDWGYRPGAATTNVVLPAAAAGAFLHASAVTYPDAWTMPPSIDDFTFTCRWDTDPPMIETLRFPPDWTHTGEWTRTQGTNTASGQIFAYTVGWSPSPYSATLAFTDNLYEHAYTLRWDPGATNGAFTGRLSQHIPPAIYSVSGSFTFTAPP